MGKSWKNFEESTKKIRLILGELYMESAEVMKKFENDPLKC